MSVTVCPPKDYDYLFRLFFSIGGWRRKFLRAARGERGNCKSQETAHPCSRRAAPTQSYKVSKSLYSSLHSPPGHIVVYEPNNLVRMLATTTRFLSGSTFTGRCSLSSRRALMMFSFLCRRGLSSAGTRCSNGQTNTLTFTCTFCIG